MVSAATVAPDVRKYATALAVSTPTVRAWPPGGVTLVHLPTFFAASAAGSGQQTVGGAGYTLQLQVAASQYDWTFGDGSTVTTSDPGGPPPGGGVRHTYPRSGSVSVGVSVAYGATYSVVTPVGSIGPLPVAGGAVRTLPAALDLEIDPATAGLVG